MQTKEEILKGIINDHPFQGFDDEQIKMALAAMEEYLQQHLATQSTGNEQPVLNHPNVMQLGEFIEKFIERNSLIRLVYKNETSGYKTVQKTWEDICMEWKVLKGEHGNNDYINHKVLGIASIATGGHYPETINIVIEEAPNKETPANNI